MRSRTKQDAKSNKVSGDDPKTPFSQSSGLRFYTRQQKFGVREPLVRAPGLHFNTGQQDPGEWRRKWTPSHNSSSSFYGIGVWW
ncbi:hypothetical protein M422DRAFT_276304 [Sphaerobolus stellatus SS14]|uniref:Uncharacterized protein n=1 Tax=Sphaerobolus stellatus (strain SS14) TaxID=990650 RepID=A0A0C9UDG7_SPHS4|nr:hypothetical protein M422DRAFT_276304 [Sphaerobolus stellatus SS14]